MTFWSEIPVIKKFKDPISNRVQSVEN